MKIAGMALLMAGVSGLAFAGTSATIPEMNVGTAGSALALLTGALLVLRGRRKK